MTLTCFEFIYMCVALSEGYGPCRIARTHATRTQTRLTLTCTHRTEHLESHETNTRTITSCIYTCCLNACDSICHGMHHGMHMLKFRMPMHCNHAHDTTRMNQGQTRANVSNFQVCYVMKVVMKGWGEALQRDSPESDCATSHAGGVGTCTKEACKTVVISVRWS